MLKRNHFLRDHLSSLSLPRHYYNDEQAEHAMHRDMILGILHIRELFSQFFLISFSIGLYLIDLYKD